jgi:hypothetical protein
MEDPGEMKNGLWVTHEELPAGLIFLPFSFPISLRKFRL